MTSMVNELTLFAWALVGFVMILMIFVNNDGHNSQAIVVYIATSLLGLFAPVGFAVCAFFGAVWLATESC